MPPRLRSTARRSRVITCLVLFAPAGFVLDCGGPRPAGPAREARAVSSAPPPAPSASASTAAPDEAPPSDGAIEGAELMPRLGAAGATKRTIACGDTRCQAGQEACVVKSSSATARAWACVDAKDEATSDGAYFCDDASDCESGRVCCASFASAASYYACTKRSGPDSDCADEICVEGDGAACPPGQACRGGRCQPKTAARASCGATRCPAEKPICRWGDDARSCLTTAQAEEASDDPSFHTADEFSLYLCTRPSDCGQGLQCCTSTINGPRLTRCGRCDMANSQVVCHQRADCLPICDQLDPALRAACRRGVTCERVGRGVKGCINIPF